ncbi:hypothetical protein ACQP2E_19295 [Actinoplanes sp. CA-015351]|uniref:hypothetical protein n=1 Tax=Actinoplanes sp. CA-015351 TaxID=3239897 RepID=UPI003D96EAC4
MKLARVALVLFAVVDVVATVLAVGHYEDRITVVTHGRPDIGPAAYAYGFAEFVLGRDVLGAVGVVWVLALGAALVLSRRVLLSREERPVVLVSGVLVVVRAVHYALAAPPSPIVDGVLNTRPVAYPLWTVAAVAVVVTAARLAAQLRQEASSLG